MAFATSDWLQAIVEGKEFESTTLEFKRELPGNSHDDKKEFLADVVGMANAMGGTIIYGLSEDAEGRADTLFPITGKPDAEILRLRNIMRTTIEPHLTNVQITPVEHSTGYAIALEIGAQFDGPYRSSLGGHYRFTQREGTQKVDMSYRQLRDAFGRRQSIDNAISNWRSNRIEHLRNTIRAGVVLDALPWVFLHILPVTSFAEHRTVDLKSIDSAGYRFYGEHFGSSRYNLDGLLFTLDPHNVRTTQSLQVFRNGIFEAGWRVRAADKAELTIASGDLSRKIRCTVEDVASLQASNGIDGPTVYGLTFLNVSEHALIYPHAEGYIHKSNPVHVSELVIPELLSESVVGANALVVDEVVRPMLDMVFQSFGLPICPFYRQGKWNDPRY